MRRLLNSPCQLLLLARAEGASNSSSLRFSRAGSSESRWPWTSSGLYWVMAVKLGLTYSTTPSRLTSKKALALCSTARWNKCRALVAVRRLWLLMTWANWSASSPANAISSVCHARLLPVCSRHSTPTTWPSMRMLASSMALTSRGLRLSAISRVRGSRMALLASIARLVCRASR
ncbi:hypothetical protein D3C85_1354360 [compost metagenome]